MKMILLFTILTILNVVLQSAHSVCLVKCNKYVASGVNAIAFMVYTIVVVSLTILQKLRKNKVWRIEATMEKCVLKTDIPYSIMNINNDNLMCVIFYCATPQETEQAKEIINAHNGKYFVSENHAHL